MSQVLQLTHVEGTVHAHVAGSDLSLGSRHGPDAGAAGASVDAALRDVRTMAGPSPAGAAAMVIRDYTDARGRHARVGVFWYGLHAAGFGTADQVRAVPLAYPAGSHS